MDRGKIYELVYSNISIQSDPKSFLYYWAFQRAVKPTFKNKLSTVSHYPETNLWKLILDLN